MTKSMSPGTSRALIAAAVMSLLAAACSTGRSVSYLRKAAPQAAIAPSFGSTAPEMEFRTFTPDTLTVRDPEGRRVIIMKAGVDENGELVVKDEIQAAVVTASFRNVAERHGKAEISFDITVPEKMLHTSWQIRLYPSLEAGKVKRQLESVIITGADYRKKQLKGYERYRRFVESISRDSLRFTFRHQLETFIRRNIPEVYKFRNDTSVVSEEEFVSALGVSRQDAVEHYSNLLMIYLNRRKVEGRGKMFRKYVKAPLLKSGIRLDTVIASGRDFIYRYVETIDVKPGLRKAGVSISGEIYEQEKQIYGIPPAGPVTFYISSMSSLADTATRFRKRIIERRVEENTACYIDFPQGSSDIIQSGDNTKEIARIKGNLASLIDNVEFDLDSIVVTASCSPEGSYRFNERLSRARSKAVADFFGNFMKNYCDSLTKAEGRMERISDSGFGRMDASAVTFSSRTNAENWSLFEKLVANDGSLSAKEVSQIHRHLKIKDPDTREAAIAGMSAYRHLREEIYPKLRIVEFSFHLHRKGMVKDTLHTTEPDTEYMEGVRALQELDYRKAAEILAPYGDYNAALALCIAGYDKRAMGLLGKMDSPRAEYLKAVLSSRSGDSARALEHFLAACRKDRRFISRGNLDPEISRIIKTYNINPDNIIQNEN